MMTLYQPLYRKSTDPDGTTVALILTQKEDKIIVLSPVHAADRPIEVNIIQVGSEEELNPLIGRPLVPVLAEEYNDTLLRNWNYDGSALYLATLVDHAPPAEVETVEVIVEHDVVGVDENGNAVVFMKAGDTVELDADAILTEEPAAEVIVDDGAVETVEDKPAKGKKA